MKVKCDHGFYMFYPEEQSELYMLKLVHGFELVPFLDGFTFAKIAALKPFSLAGQDYGGQAAKSNVCAAYGDIFRANGFVYNIGIAALTDKAKITAREKLYQRPGDNFTSLSLPQAGAFISNTERLLSFEGFFYFDFKKFGMTRIEYAG